MKSPLQTFVSANTLIFCSTLCNSFAFEYLSLVNIPLERVNEEWKKTNWNRDMHTIARHYAIFRDLFDNATFYPQPFLRIFYDYDEEFLTPVYNGNKILPSEVSDDVI